MVHFELTRESAYVVPALRWRTAGHHTWHAQSKTLGLIILLVLLVHLLLGAALITPWVSMPTTVYSNTSMEAVIVLEDALVDTAQTQATIQPVPTRAHEKQPHLKRLTPNERAVVITSQINQHSKNLLPNPKSMPAQKSTQTTAPAAITGSSVHHSQSSGANNSMVSNQTCSIFASFNRRYPNVVAGNSTVTLTLTRNAQGTVTSVSLLKSSGHTGLDNFALQSARNARFVSNPDCANRNFHLPIKFSTKSS